MPFASTRAALTLSAEDQERLTALAKSRTASHVLKMRAQVLLGYVERRPLSMLAGATGLSLAAVNRCINKARPSACPERWRICRGPVGHRASRPKRAYGW